jgi:hypothetical protein
VSSAAVGRTTVVAIITTIANAVTLPSLKSRRRRDLRVAHSMFWSDDYRLLVRRQSTSRVNTFPPTNEFWKFKKKQREQKDSEINYCTLVPLITTFSSNNINFTMKAHIREVHVFISHNERKRQSVCKRNSPLIFSLNRIL